MSHSIDAGRLWYMMTRWTGTPWVLLALVGLAGGVEAHSATSSRYGSFAIAESGSGPPMVFIPGLTSPGWVWDEVVAHYRSRFTCYILTLAGFGEVPAVDDPSLERVRDDLIHFIRERQLVGSVLVGHSIGGMVAYWVAATEPTLVGRVVSVEGATWVPALFDSTATVESAAVMADGMRSGIARLGSEAFAQMSDRMLGGQVGDTAARRRLAPVAARSDPLTTATFLADQYTTDLRDVVSAIESPVLLLVATGGIAPDARTAYVESARRQLARVGSVRVAEIEGARHFIQLDAPARLGVAEFFTAEEPGQLPALAAPDRASQGVVGAARRSPEVSHQRITGEAAELVIRRTADPSSPADASIIEGERRAILREALDALPDDTRDCVILYYREGESAATVGYLLGISHAAARKRLERARPHCASTSWIASAKSSDSRLRAPRPSPP